MVQIFLSHLNAAGAETRVELDRYSNDISTFYLPNDLPTNLTIEHLQTTTHTYTRLDLFGENVALIKYDFPGATAILLTGNFELQVPSSTDTIQRSFLLRPDDQFLTSAGRWQIHWDRPDDTSHSMRPPSLFPTTDVSSQQMEELVIPSVQAATVNVEDTEQSSGAITGDGVSVEVTKLQLPSDTSDQEIVEHRPQSPPVSPAGDTIPSEKENHNLDDISTHDPASDNDSSTKKSAISNEPVASDTQEDGIVKMQPGSIHNNINELSRTIQHNNTELDSGSLDRMDDNHAEVHDVSLIKSVDSDVTASASEEDRIIRKRTTIRAKRSLLDIEADVTGPPKKSRRATLEFETTDEEDDTVVIPTINIPAQSRIKKKNTPSRAKNKLTARSIKGKRRTSVIQTTKDDRSHPEAAETPPPRSSTRLALTPSSTPRSSLANSAAGNPSKPVIVFSSGSEIQHDKKIMNSFQKLGGIVTDKIGQANTLCIGDGPLRKTAKLVIAVATGKDIVTDKWLLEAHVQQRLPVLQDFVPQDQAHEKEWNFNLVEAIERGRQGLDLLRGYDIYLTHRIQVDLGNLKTEVKQVAMALGANKVGYSVPARRITGKDILIIGSPSLDEEGGKVSKLEVKMYNKDLLLLGALRGHLELDSDEFTIEAPVKEEA